MQSQNKKRAREEIIQDVVKEIAKELDEITFGQIVIYIQNSWPYRTEIRTSKVIKRRKYD